MFGRRPLDYRGSDQDSGSGVEGVEGISRVLGWRVGGYVWRRNLKKNNERERNKSKLRNEIKRNEITAGVRKGRKQGD